MPLDGGAYPEEDNFIRMDIQPARALLALSAAVRRRTSNTSGNLIV
jgi:hypothetical protein